MRIIYVTGEFIDPKTKRIVDGGLANYLYKITQAMVKRGHEVHVLIAYHEHLYMLHKGVHLHYFQLYGPSYGFKTAPNKFQHLKKYWKFYLMKTMSLFKVLDSFLVQIEFDMFGRKINRELININRAFPIDIVQYPNISYEALYPAPFPYCIRISSHRALCIAIENSSKDPWAIATVRRVHEAMKRAPFIFGPSQYIIDLYKQDPDFQNKNFKLIETLHSPVLVQDDPVIFEQVKDKIQNNPYLIFYGTVGVLKGITDLADIIYPLFEKYPGLFFVLVGKEPHGQKPVDYIRDKAGQFADRIIYFKQIAHSQLFPLIKNAKGVVLPSRTDNFPNSCIEAMVLKKAIVGTYEGSFAQLLDDNVSGFICHGSNPPSLLDAICRLMDTPDHKLKEMGELAYMRTLELAPEKIAEQTEQYYQHIIDNWPKNI